MASFPSVHLSNCRKTTITSSEHKYCTLFLNYSFSHGTWLLSLSGHSSKASSHFLRLLERYFSSSCKTLTTSKKSFKIQNLCVEQLQNIEATLIHRSDIDFTLQTPVTLTSHPPFWEWPEWCQPGTQTGVPERRTGDRSCVGRTR